ncbi:hypothetical protein Pint_13826 [Pistacia integerrima]|uniref:Uncharacterized protein n=1 Tax=Pistacia integerrima TaxID=434235 RepID=A0ACC0Y6N6_9ROSI|nr:hypothetical protein Pint_13826 [Pistacia integerrima]
MSGRGKPGIGGWCGWQCYGRQGIGDVPHFGSASSIVTMRLQVVVEEDKRWWCG